MNPENQYSQNQDSSNPTESTILPNAQARRTPVFDPTGKVEQIRSDETKVADVRRHPLGLFLLYLQTIVGIGLAFALIFLLLPTFFDTVGLNEATVKSFIGILILITAVFAVIFLTLAARIYRANQLIVTDENVTQVLQIGLFRRKISELSMHNVEDVTADQHGIMQTFLNYGTLTIETAGEQNNFTFIYCPNPNAYAKAILDARQLYMQRHSSSIYS